MCAKRISEAEGERWVQVCAIEALVDRAIVPLYVAGQHLLLVQDGDVLFATERACPHEGADLALGHCSNGRLYCPRHQAWFTLSNGAVSPGWCFRSLRTYPVRLDGTEIHILIDLSR